MRVIGRVGTTPFTVRDGASKKYRQDVVVHGICLGLIEGEYDERAIVVKVRVV